VLKNASSQKKIIILKKPQNFTSTSADKGNVMPGNDTDSLSVLKRLPARYFSQASKSSRHLNSRLSKSTLKSLHNLKRKEQKVYNRLAKIDSVAARNLFSNSLDSLSHLQQYLQERQQLLTQSLNRQKF
jgi:hypothetical protein